MVAWVNRYIGVPYKYGGDTIAGADCWGHVRLVLREEFGVIVPQFFHGEDDDDVPGLIKDNKASVSHVRVAEPEVGDLVLLNIRGKPHHIGIIVGNPKERNLLHTLFKQDSALAFYNRGFWGTCIEGFYRVR